MDRVRIGVLTVSDRASTGTYPDKGGPAVREYLSEALVTDHDFVSMVVPDDFVTIKSALTHLVDNERCSLVVATGGTGPAPRDVTPEATEAVCTRMIPGFGEAMRAASMAVVPTAILSRQCAGIRGGSLIITVPGNPSAVADCLGAVVGAIPDCIDLIGGPRFELRSHIRTFRPPD